MHILHTPDPGDEPIQTAAPPRFVLLEHTCDNDHLDLMIERDGTLDTWALALPPDPHPQIVHQLPTHRLAYLEYEGPLSGGRGSVRRIDAGTYLIAGPSTDNLRLIRLKGSILHGILTLRRLESHSPRGRHWLITLHQ